MLIYTYIFFHINTGYLKLWLCDKNSNSLLDLFIWEFSFLKKYSRVYGLQLNTLIITVGGSHGMATAGGLVGFCKWHLEE